MQPKVIGEVSDKIDNVQSVIEQNEHGQNTMQVRPGIMVIIHEDIRQHHQ